jgi:hypothetical protein
MYTFILKWLRKLYPGQKKNNPEYITEKHAFTLELCETFMKIIVKECNRDGLQVNYVLVNKKYCQKIVITKD